jgi:signal transduction histidine kinase
MNIRFKVMALVAALFGALVAMQVLIEEQGIMPSFASLEQADARTSMTRVNFALDRTLEGLESTASDWSDWGELFQYMQNRNPAFLATYTTPVAMAPLKVDMLLLVDRNGDVAFSAARAVGSEQPLSIDLAKLRSLPESFPWRRELTTARSMHGLIRTNQGVMMLAAAPILDGSGKGQSLGLAILGRLLTPAQLREIGTQAQATLAMREPPGGTSASPAPSPALIEIGAITEVFHSYDDIYGQPVMTLRVDVPRSLTAHAHAAVTYSLWYLVAAAVVVLIFVIILLNRLVLDPIARVTQHAVAVGAGGDLTARLDFAGDDEIGRLAREFDRMVERVAESRRQLVDQAFHAGYAELAKGIMHHLETAMASFGAHLTSLGGRLRSAPVADVAAAAGELAQDPTDPQRRSDLAQFVQYGCEQIESAVTQAQADMAVMERQASIVTSTLAEQRASASNEHVLESVRLPELLAQTLDIVPDACRRRLTVETDDSWRAVGVVTVARTVLRLVLQNLIINAADAVREAGQGEAGQRQGALRLTAAIEPGEGQPQLHIECQDNGNGIAPEHLKHVFEKGYSTKSRHTNEGIGLHWCANAVRSLGGRIWAVSAGAGLGASLHVILPISGPISGSMSGSMSGPMSGEGVLHHG